MRADNLMSASKACLCYIKVWLYNLSANALKGNRLVLVRRQCVASGVVHKGFPHATKNFISRPFLVELQNFLLLALHKVVH
jgi:hypothetical protein